MYIAMNRFRVIRGNEAEFEEIWKNRQSYLNEVPGFQTFHLLKGPVRDEYTLYASHVVWDSHAHFEAWTKSDAFRQAHAQAGQRKPLYLSHPRFEGFETVI